MRRGVVVDFDAHVGLGHVRDPSGETWLFHCTRIADGTRAIDAGAAVVFEIGPGGPGQWEATSVLKVP
ncbi:MAG: hypothetical protein ACYDH6_17230 [Acidimicrobiales bacterium]